MPFVFMAALLMLLLAACFDLASEQAIFSRLAGSVSAFAKRIPLRAVRGEHESSKTHRDRRKSPAKKKFDHRLFLLLR